MNKIVVQHCVWNNKFRVKNSKVKVQKFLALQLMPLCLPSYVCMSFDLDR